MYNEWNAQMKIVDMLQYLSNEYSKQLYIINNYKASEEKLILNGDFHHDYHAIFDACKNSVPGSKSSLNYHLVIADNTYQHFNTFADFNCSIWKETSKNWQPWKISLSIAVPNFIYQYVGEKKLPVQHAPGGYRERYDFDFSEKVDFEEWKLAIELIKDTQEKNAATFKTIVRNAKYAAIHSICKDSLEL